MRPRSHQPEPACRPAQPDLSGSLVDALKELFDAAEDLAADKIGPHFVNPLAEAIASRS